MTFEEWYEEYIFKVVYELTTEDMKKSFEAGYSQACYDLVEEVTDVQK